MQNARDTFYIALRDRLAALNPERTTVIRGLTRPGLLVVENELVTAGLPLDVFCLRWRETAVDEQSALPFVTMSCEFTYATAGTSMAAGMDRGRLLAAMDMELCGALREPPERLQKMNYVTNPPSALLTNVFWGDTTFRPVETQGERLTRTAVIPVFSFQEEGER